MKTTLAICLLFLVIGSKTTLGQFGKNNLKERSDMNATNENKEAIRSLYEVILNGRKFELFDNVVSEKYSNAKGGTGVEGFKKGVADMLNAFPDAQWRIEELVAEGNKIIVKQNVVGTHTGVFQNINPTGRTITNDGFVIYEFEGGKIVGHQIQTDRLLFLQQLGVISTDLTPSSETADSSVYFIDKFLIPERSVDEFILRMQFNRNFIRTLPGFIRDNVIAQRVADGKLKLVTIAEWKSQQHLDSAKALVQDEYLRIEFNPAEFLLRLDITMEREEYSAFNRQ